MPLSPSARVRASAALLASSPCASVTVSAPHCRRAAAFLFDSLAASPPTHATISAGWRGANALHPTSPSPATLSWIFLVDTLNFCFWGPAASPRWSVSYRGRIYEGYWALCASVNRALEDGIPLLDPSFCASVDTPTLARVFRSHNDVPIPLLEQRVAALNEAGAVLCDRFAASVHNLVAEAAGSAQNLIQLVVDNFMSYNDVAPITSASLPSAADPHALQHPADAHTPHTLYFYKRAQILVADIWACFASTDLYSFSDISSLTMFADYRVPQVLVFMGAISYSDELLEILNRGEEIPSGDRRELEIRGCSIHAVELIRAEMEKLAKDKADQNPSPMQPDSSVVINSVVIDFALWDYGTKWKTLLGKSPIHRTKSVYY